MPIEGVWLAGTVTDEVLVTLWVGPVGGVPVTVPVLWREPASTSAWVVV